MELLIICLAFGVIGAVLINLLRDSLARQQPPGLIFTMLVMVVVGGLFIGVWGHLVDVSTASRHSSLEVPYWVWMQPASEDEWQIWEYPLEGEWWHANGHRYRTPKESRCQMFHVNRRRLVPLYEDDQVTTARYEIHWLYRLFDRFNDECEHGTVIRFHEPHRQHWLHALSGWGD